MKLAKSKALRNKRVAFIVRPDFETKPGGDMRQISAYAEAFEADGYDVRVISDVKSLLSGPFDLILISNLDEPVLLFFTI